MRRAVCAGVMMPGWDGGLWVARAVADWAAEGRRGRMLAPCRWSVWLGGGAAAQGEDQGETCAVAGLAAEFDASVVGIGQFCGDSQADAAAGRVGGSVAPPEPFEYVWLVLGGDARPGVADLKAGLAAGLGECHLYPAAGRGEFQRVAQQVGNDLVQPAGVGFDWCGLERRPRLTWAAVKLASQSSAAAAAISARSHGCMLR